MSILLLTAGAKLISLNEKQRGFPTGLRVMADSQYKEAVLLVEPSLEKALHNGIPLDVQQVEVSVRKRMKRGR